MNSVPLLSAPSYTKGHIETLDSYITYIVAVCSLCVCAVRVGVLINYFYAVPGVRAWTVTKNKKNLKIILFKI